MPCEEAQTAVDRMLDRIPASLYEVAWQYSLFGWYASSQSDDIDWDLDPEHLAYMTPRKKSELFGQPDSLVIAFADLSDPDTPRLRPESPVEITTLTEKDRYRIGHSYPINKTNQTAHSVTTYKKGDAHHYAGLVDAWYGRGNLVDRFSRWAQSEYATEVRERADSENKEILSALWELGDDDEEMSRLSDTFLEIAGGEDVELDALITIAVRLPGEDRYKFPGEVGVLNEVMRTKKRARLDSINVEDASSEGVGYVSGEHGTVTGGSPGIFGMYSKQPREHFTDLDTKGSSAWRARPLEFDTAAAVAAAGSLFDEFYRGLGQNRRLYVLPYLATRSDDLDPEAFEWFHERVYTQIQDAEGGSDGNFDQTLEELFFEASRVDNEPVESPDVSSSSLAFDTSDDTENWDRVRFAVVHQVTGNPDRVFFDTLDGLEPTLALERAHFDVLSEGVFTDGRIFDGRPSPESSPLLGASDRLARYILYGGYFRRTTEPTRSSRAASETPGAGDIDDSRMRRVRNLLTGTNINAEELLEQYIHQLVQDQNDRFSADDDYVAFPSRSVVEQYAQLRALSTTEVLDTSRAFDFTTTPMATDPSNRTEKLESFIESHDALAGDAEEAVFTLGGLVGRITAFQSREGVSSTLVRRYPVDYLTKQTVVEVTKEVLQMDNSYAEAEQNRSYWTNNRYHQRLTDTMLAANPRDWNLSEAEIQWVYSLGIAYGLNDTADYHEENEEQTAEPEPTA
jgi:hypothetical protein